MLGNIVWQSGKSEYLWVNEQGNCSNRCDSAKSKVTCSDGIVSGIPSASAYWLKCTDTCPANSGTITFM